MSKQRAAYKAAIEKFDIPLSASPSTGPPMTLCNMRELGVQRLIASCLNDACRHQALTTDWIGFRRVPDIFEGLWRRTSQCKVLIQGTEDWLVRRRSRWISRR